MTPMVPAPWMTVSPGLMACVDGQRLPMQAGSVKRGVLLGKGPAGCGGRIDGRTPISGHGAVDGVAVALAVRAHVVGAGQAVGALSADEGRGLPPPRARPPPSRPRCRRHRRWCRPTSCPRITGHWMVQLWFHARGGCRCHTPTAPTSTRPIRADRGFSDFLHRHIAGLPPVLHDCTHGTPASINEIE